MWFGELKARRGFSRWESPKRKRRWKTSSKWPICCQLSFSVLSRCNALLILPYDHLTDLVHWEILTELVENLKLIDYERICGE